MSRPAVVITGVSSGVGAGLAHVLATAGYFVFGTVRSQSDAVRLGSEFAADCFMPLQMDVTNPHSVRAAAELVAQQLGQRKLAALINNAGIGIHGPLELQPEEEWTQQIEVNLIGAYRVARAFLPLLGTDPSRTGAPGKILNMSSLGGRIAVPLNSAYCASKFGLEGMSHALRRELLPFGIDVVIIAPAAVKSALWDKADAVDMSRYSGSRYCEPLVRFMANARKERELALSPAAVGEVVTGVLKGRLKATRYLIARNPFTLRIISMLPQRVFDKLMGHALKLLPNRLKFPENGS